MEYFVQSYHIVSQRGGGVNFLSLSTTNVTTIVALFFLRVS